MERKLKIKRKREKNRVYISQIRYLLVVILELNSVSGV